MLIDGRRASVCYIDGLLSLEFGGAGSKVDFLTRLDIGVIAIQIAVLLFSLSLHEAAHAWTASRWGDHTARSLGRVTLNPRAHIDPVGTLLFPLLMFAARLPIIGWARPVPFDPTRLRDPGRAQVYISLAGPASNLAAAGAAFALLALLNLTLAGSREPIFFLAATMRLPGEASVLGLVAGVLFHLVVINLALAVFNLIPIPLDGHWILYALLPAGAGAALRRFGSYGFLLLYLMMFLGMFRFIFIPIDWMRRLLLAM